MGFTFLGATGRGRTVLGNRERLKGLHYRRGLAACHSAIALEQQPKRRFYEGFEEGFKGVLGNDQGRINVNEMRKLLNIPHNMAYNIRSVLLEEYHEKLV